MNDDIRGAVRANYGATARAGLGSDQDAIQGIAQAFGYSEEELASIPASANMGLSCGNPVASASIREGETIVDLGSGGGLDVFLASKKVGEGGLAIGVDMTGDMISLARKNAAAGGYQNVRFYLAEIEAMPLATNSVDCVISNCVINLCPDKGAALAEIFRVLKPGGRLAISDITLKKPLPAEVERHVAAWTGCISGALLVEDFRVGLATAGFEAVHIQDTGADLGAYAKGGHSACCAPPEEATAEETEASSCCSPTEQATECCGPGEAAKAEPAGGSEFHESLGGLLAEFDVNEYAASVRVFAVKP